MIAALPARGDVMLIDADLPRQHLRRLPAERRDDHPLPAQRSGRPGQAARGVSARAAANAKLVVVEGIYSMLGDRAPLADIAADQAQHGAYLLVDEAHSLGVLGDHGRGAGRGTGVEADVDFVIGTFSKSLGAIGGSAPATTPSSISCAIANRPYVFTASPSPSIIASTRAASRLAAVAPGAARPPVGECPNRSTATWRRWGSYLGPEPSPIIAVRLADRDKAFAAWVAC